MAHPTRNQRKQKKNGTDKNTRLFPFVVKSRFPSQALVASPSTLCFSVGVLQQVAEPLVVLQQVLGSIHLLLGVGGGILLRSTIEPATSPDQLPDIIEVSFILVVTPAGEVPILGRHQFEVDPLWGETPGAVPASKVEGAAQRPLHQDVSCAVLILPKARHGVVLTASQTDPIGSIDSLEHPHGAARDHLQGPWLLPEEAIERLAHVKGEGLRPAIVELEEEHAITGWDLIGIINDEDVIWAQVAEARDAITGEEGAEVIVSNPAILAATGGEVVQEDVEHLVADVVEGAVEEHLAELEGPRLSIGREVRLAHHEGVHHVSQLVETDVQQVELMVDVDSVDDPPGDLPRHEAVLGGQVGVLDHRGDPAAGAMPTRQAHALHPLAPLGPAGAQRLTSRPP